ncbi:MAG: phosphoheptose isomerase, partial [Sphingobacteriales bacterium]
VDDLKIGGKLSPKILIVAPEKRLSWQYHHRRAEIWQVVEGNVGIVTSDNDTEGELKSYAPAQQIKLQKGERHRLIGLKDWGVVAEIWQHTDAENPSDEDDIVRVQDDFGR